MGSMYRQYVKRYSISREVKEALIEQNGNYNSIQKAEDSENKYLGLSILMFDLMHPKKDNNARYPY